MQIDSLMVRFFPQYPGPGWAQRLIFVALASLIATLELPQFFYYQNPSVETLWILFLSIILLASCGWFAPWSEILYTIIFDITLFTSLSNSMPFLVLGVCAISVSWLSRSWVIPGLMLYFSAELLALFTATRPIPQLTGFLLDASLVLPLGFFLRWHRLNTETMSTRLRQAKEEVAQVETRIRQDLATELHDTIARDLVRLVVLANRLEKHPDSATSEDFRLISELSTAASLGIRPVISGLDKRRSRKNITQIIEEVASMLSARDMKLRTVGTSELNALLTRQQLLLAALMIQECATNALKYGVPGTEVALEATLDESRVLLLTMRNEISPAPDYAGVSSGFGLNNLESRLNEENGELFFGKVEQQWIIKAVIPPS